MYMYVFDSESLILPQCLLKLLSYCIIYYIIVVASKRPRKRNWSYKKNARKSSRSSECGEDQDNFMYNTCASVDCVHPHNRDKLVDWVQCDDCDDWYHVKCTGLTLESVRPKSAKFHCGCV